MKVFLTIVIILFSFQSWCQLNFKEVKYFLLDPSTTFKTVAIGDVNNDGLNDIVVGPGNSFYDTHENSILIYSPNTDSKLMSPIELRYPTSIPGSESLNVLQITDLNNDKLNDILIGYDDSIGIFYQLDTGKFSKLESYYSGSGVSGLQTGDLNDDGLTDIAVCDWNSKNINIFTQKVGGGFFIKSIPTEGGSRLDQIEIADVNGDHLNDVIYKPGIGGESTLQILYQDPNRGMKDSVFLYNYTSAVIPFFNGIGIGDLNNDGRNDIVGSIGGNDGQSLVLMYQDSLGKIDNNIEKIPALDIPTPVKIADLNGDGNIEIIVGHNAGGSVTIFEKDSTQHYSKYTIFHSSFYFYPYSMAVGDVNNDNKIDIVSVDPMNASISILYNISGLKSFDTIETKIANVKVLRDTTSSTELISELMEDPSPTCKINRELHKQILTKSASEFYSCDSLTIKITNIGNLTSRDTITKHFSYLKTRVISSDTIKNIVSTDQLSISTSSVSLNSTINSSDSIFIHSNICWNLSTDQNWLLPSKNSGSGGNLILLTATANLSTSPRSATVTIIGKDVQTQKVNVIQEAAMPFLTTSSSSVILSDSVNNVAYINISSNINWKILNPISWIKIDQSEGSNDAFITISAPSDTTDADRSGIIFIQGDNNIMVSVDITQLFTKKGVKNPVDESDIKIYPNPFKENINIDVSESVTPAFVYVCDISGRKLVSKELNKKSTEINLSILSKGIYYIQFFLNNNSVARKIIKY